MSSRGSHRGAHPRDAKLFRPEALPDLVAAQGDFAWLLSHGYAEKSSLKLVGDRYSLAERQRRAVRRATCSDAQRAERARKEVPVEALAGRDVWIDGYNLLTTIEGALGGAIVLEAADGCMRDISGVHGSYRVVAETVPAITLIGDALTALSARRVRWFFDRPVSNSGRLKKLLEEQAAAAGWPWDIEVVKDPDAVLSHCGHIIVTADGEILDRGGPWYNLARHVIRSAIPAARVVRFS